MKRLLLCLLLIATPAMAEQKYFRDYGVAGTIRFFLVEADGKAPALGVSCATGDITLLKDGGAVANTTACFNERGAGWYSIFLDATEMQGTNLQLTVNDQDGPAWLAKGLLVETTGAVASGAQHEDKPVNVGFVTGTAVTDINDFKSTAFDPATDTVIANITQVNGVAATAADFQADVTGLSTFDPAADEVNVGEVKGTAVTDVNDFKADVSAVSTFDPATDEVIANMTKVNGAAVALGDMKADVSGLSTFDPATDEVDANIVKVTSTAVTDVDDFKGAGGGSTFDPATDVVIANITQVNGAAVTLADLVADISTLSTFDPATDEVDSNIVKVTGTAVTNVDDFKGAGGGGAASCADVWDCSTAAHGGAGTFGKAVSDGGGGGISQRRD